MSLMLMEDDVERLRRILLDLLVRSESDDCILCDAGGIVLVREGPESWDPLQISALGAGVFAASRELARILGENEFSAVFHQGEKKSIFIRAVNQEVLLVNIFSKAASVGLVKLYSTPTVAECRAIFAEIKARGTRPPGNTPMPTFVLRDKDIFGSST